MTSSISEKRRRAALAKWYGNTAKALRAAMVLLTADRAMVKETPCYTFDAHRDLRLYSLGLERTLASLAEVIDLLAVELRESKSSDQVTTLILCGRLHQIIDQHVLSCQWLRASESVGSDEIYQLLLGWHEHISHHLYQSLGKLERGLQSAVKALNRKELGLGEPLHRVLVTLTLPPAPQLQRLRQIVGSSAQNEMKSGHQAVEDGRLGWLSVVGALGFGVAVAQSALGKDCEL